MDPTIGTYVGIDPGLSGAIASITSDGQVEIIPMPVIKKDNKGSLDLRAIYDHLKNQTWVRMVALEKVHAMPVLGGKPMAEILRNSKLPDIVITALLRMVSPRDTACPVCGRKPAQGVQSAFAFGDGYGALKGILTALERPFILVPPQTWKAQVLHGLEWKGDKAASVRYCQQKFPNVSLLPTERSRKPNDGMADSLCLAEHAKEQATF